MRHSKDNITTSDIIDGTLFTIQDIFKEHKWLVVVAVIAAIPALVWLLIVSGMWVGKTARLIGGSNHPLDAVIMPPIIEGTIETFRFFDFIAREVISPLIHHVPRVLAAAIPTVTVHCIILMINRTIHDEDLKLFVKIPFYFLYLIALILQIRWTFIGLPVDLMTELHELYGILIEELHAVQYILGQISESITGLFSVVWIFFVFSTPVVIVSAIVISVMHFVGRLITE